MADDAATLLRRIESGDPSASGELLPLVYAELRALAQRKLAREKPGQTLQATALVHEAYLRLVGGDSGRKWDSRGHFFAAAGEAMRRILVENARRKRTVKHGGGRRRIDLETAEIPATMASEELLALHEALELLDREDPLKARLVTLRFFAGLTIEQAADALGIARVTAHRWWTYARAWLHMKIAGDGKGATAGPSSHEEA